MPAWGWILIAVAIVLVIVLAVTLAVDRRRSRALRTRFGPEYERTVESREGGRRAAEAELRGRQKQRARVDIRPLPEEARARFADEWHAVQERFVDQPSMSVMAAQDLLNRVMGARGYPMEDFDQQADLVSVDHPRVVDNYRIANDICGQARTQRASTEDLREAMLRYRSLFDELLHDDRAVPAEQQTTDRGR